MDPKVKAPAEVRAWVARAVAENGLGEVGALEPLKIRAWASVLRASTAGGDVYFKANAPGGRHEPALVSALAEAWPSLVPAPLAIDPERGWLLTLDHGQRIADTLEGEPLLAAFEEILPRYAEIQIASARDLERWLALGVPDLRLQHVPAQAERLIRANTDLEDAERTAMLALVPRLEACCAELAAHPFAHALEHGDLHGANVLVGPSGTWLFDWADSSVCHPFCTLLVTCNTIAPDLESAEGRQASARLVDAYLEPFASLAPANDLRGEFSPAAWVAHIGRALDWERMLGRTDTPDRAEWLPRIATWLRLWEARSSWARHGAWPWSERRA